MEIIELGSPQRLGHEIMSTADNGISSSGRGCAGTPVFFAKTRRKSSKSTVLREQSNLDTERNHFQAGLQPTGLDKKTLSSSNQIFEILLPKTTANSLPETAMESRIQNNLENYSEENNSIHLPRNISKILSIKPSTTVLPCRTDSKACSQRTSCSQESDSCHSVQPHQQMRPSDVLASSPAAPHEGGCSPPSPRRTPPVPSLRDVCSGSPRQSTGPSKKSPQKFSTTTALLRLFFHVLLLLPCLVTSQGFPSTDAADDVRCFLEPGGSVANFFINESLPVGAVLGSLMIGGDPRPDGDILLTLADRGAPVQIAEHSKDLILAGRIDKEGKEGQSHIYLEVICKKLRTIDPTMTIPVNIRVTDVNDNAPIFQGAPYHVNISEATVVGTIIFSDIFATDADQKGPFSTLKYTIGPGPHQDKFEFESPLRGSLRLKQPLDYETAPMFNVTIVAQDLGTPPQRSKTVLTVFVSDSDDQNPAFTRQRYMATLPQPPVMGAPVEIQPERIWARDQDEGIGARVTYGLGSDVPEANLFSIDPFTGHVFLNVDIADDQITQPVSLSIYATQTDNPDRRAGTILTVSRRGFRSSQLQFVKTLYNVSVPENVPPKAVIADTIINRVIDKNVRFRLSDSGRGVFHITPEGQIQLESSLDFEESDSQYYDMEIFVTDGEYNDTAQLLVTVLNVNDWDPRFRYPQYEFAVSADQVVTGAVLGAVEVADGDIGDRIQLSLRGQDARLFTISPTGELRLSDATTLNTSEAHVVVMAQDSGNPPRQSSVPVKIQFPVGASSLAASFQPSSWFLLVLVFGGLLAVFILIVICLAVYIHKHKKYREDPAAALPTKLSQLMPAAMAGSKVQPLPLAAAQSRNGRVNGTINERSNGLLHHTLTNGRARDNNAFTGSEEEEDDVDSPPLSNGRRRYGKSSVAPHPGNGSGSSSGSSANGDGASLNGTSSTASVGTPEMQRINGHGPGDGTARATGGMPLHHRPTPVPPPPPPPPPSGTVSPTSYVFPHSASYQHSTFSPRRRSTSPASQFGESTSTFAPHVLRPPSAFSSGGGSLSSEPGAVNTTLCGPDQSSRCVWPVGSIPKRVKKLSWEDELYSQTELDPEVSVTPMPQQPRGALRQQQQGGVDGPGLTVYF